MYTFLFVISIITLIFGLWITIITASNRKLFKKTNKSAKAKSYTKEPKISIVIPARNEEENLPRLLDSILNEDYKNFEIIVVDDRSEDKTNEIIRNYTQKDERIHLVETEGKEKLSNHGKVNALIYGSREISGEYTLFTDADTWQEKNCLSSVLNIMINNNLDLISGFPSQKSPSFLASVISGAMLFINTILPQWLIRKVKSKRASFGIGQFMMMKTSSYRDVGGFEKMKYNVLDDLSLIKDFIKHGKKYYYTVLSEYVNCEMYKNGKDAFRGIERSISGVFPKNVFVFILLLFAVFGLFMIFSAPILSPLFYFMGNLKIMLTYLLGYLLCCIPWYFAARDIKLKKGASFSASLSIYAICVMLLDGDLKRISGRGFLWKGRVVN